VHLVNCGQQSDGLMMAKVCHHLTVCNSNSYETLMAISQRRVQAAWATPDGLSPVKILISPYAAREPGLEQVEVLF